MGLVVLIMGIWVLGVRDAGQGLVFLVHETVSQYMPGMKCDVSADL